MTAKLQGSDDPADQTEILHNVPSQAELLRPQISSHSNIQQLREVEGIPPTSAHSLAPIEVWLHIFELVVQSEELYDNDEPPEVTAPWILSQVCHIWRSSVLSTPSLWAVIVINMRKILKHCITHTQNRLQLQLERSQEWPLEIIIYSRSYFWVVGETILSTLYPHIHRSISIDVRGTQRSTSFPSIPPNMYYPFLRELGWSCSENTSSLSHNPNFFKNAPNLCTVHLRGCITTEHVEYGLVPFSQLVDVTFDRIKVAWWDIIPLLTAVESLRIGDSANPPEPNLTGQFCILPKLRLLKVNRASNMWAKPTDPSIFAPDAGLHSAPNLKDLTLENVTYGWELELVARFLRRSACPLITLVARNVAETSSSSLESLFYSAPTLTTLNLQFRISFPQVTCDTANLVTELLTRTNPTKPTAPEFCPSLHSIYLGFSNKPPIRGLNLAALVRMADIRQPLGLREVGIENLIGSTMDSKNCNEDEAAAIETQRLMNDFGVRFLI